MTLYFALATAGGRLRAVRGQHRDPRQVHRHPSRVPGAVSRVTCHEITCHLSCVTRCNVTCPGQVPHQRGLRVVHPPGHPVLPAEGVRPPGAVSSHVSRVTCLVMSRVTCPSCDGCTSGPTQPDLATCPWPLEPNPTTTTTTPPQSTTTTTAAPMGCEDFQVIA